MMTSSRTEAILNVLARGREEQLARDVLKIFGASSLRECLAAYGAVGAAERVSLDEAVERVTANASAAFWLSVNSPNSELRTPNPESRVPNPESRLPNPDSESRIPTPNSELRTPNSESRTPNGIPIERIRIFALAAWSVHGRGYAESEAFASRVTARFAAG